LTLSGKTALVAGASRGIGLAIAKGIAAAGAHTILAARGLDRLEAEAKGLMDQGYSASALSIDMTRADSVSEAAKAAGTVDILINVAGTNIRKRFEEYTPDEYRFILDTNLHGIVQLTQLIGAKMQAKGGKIINIGSLMTLSGLPYLSIYALTKGALGQLTKALAAEWGRYGIQVNCIAPGFILTDLNRSLWQQPEMAAWLKGCQANPRIGDPEDIAPLAVFLAGPGSDYITGQVIAVDGGYSTTAVWPFQA
jgi:NAD(P)-dependent dehydrogenase (short-subunit alcohol dehydrogenase family)